MKMITEIRQLLGDEWLPYLYRDKVRVQRTRAIILDIPRRINSAVIQHTLLGIELKVGKNRISCPDLPTARYLITFARLGHTEVAIPYDITKISPIADELETSWQRTVLLIEERAGQQKPTAANYRRAIIKEIRSELAAIGAGETMPQFNAPTSSRHAK